MSLNELESQILTLSVIGKTGRSMSPFFHKSLIMIINIVMYIARLFYTHQHLRGQDNNFVREHSLQKCVQMKKKGTSFCFSISWTELHVDLQWFHIWKWCREWRVVVVIQHVLGKVKCHLLDDPSSSKWSWRNFQGGKRLVPCSIYE